MLVVAWLRMEEGGQFIWVGLSDCRNSIVCETYIPLLNPIEVGSQIFKID